MIKTKSMKQIPIYLISVIVIGTLLRLILAFTFYGSIDVDNAYYFTKMVNSGQNVYQTTSYNYTPLWLIFLLFARFLSERGGIPFYFIIKLYAIIADVTISILLFAIARNRVNYSPKYSALIATLYAFSPISLLITSLHGQFDSIPLAFILASYLAISAKQQILQLSALLLSLAISFKIWPILLLPLFALKVQGNLIKKITFAMGTTIVAFLPLLPYLISKPWIVAKKVFFYFGTADFGLPVFFEFFTKNAIVPFSTIVALLEAKNLLIGRLILFASVAITLIISYKKRFPFFKVATLIFLTIYVFSIRISAQYLLWIIPFALLTRDKMIHIYSISAALALLANYQGHHSRAIELISRINFTTLPTVHLPFGVTIFLWWTICVIWFLKIIKS